MTYTDRDLLDQLTECLHRYGRVTQETFDTDPEFADHKTVVSHFGSWGHGLQKANVADSTVVHCPDCQRYFARIATHWAASDCIPEAPVSQPSLSD